MSENGLDANGLLNPGEVEFVEAMGRYFEGFGMPRIGGRIIGLLMIAERPLSLDDMAGTLSVSRASISTNARLGLASGMVERVTYPGDRRDYYTFRNDAWGQRLETGIAGLRTLRQIVEQGIAAVDPSNTAALDRLSISADHFLFLEESLSELAKLWKERQARHLSDRPETRSGG